LCGDLPVPGAVEVYFPYIPFFENVLTSRDHPPEKGDVYGLALCKKYLRGGQYEDHLSGAV
jgi:hypothetical protein